MKSDALASRRIPSLDGLRGIAILLVLFDHLQLALFGHYFGGWATTGQHGVTVFFVLSGFLITSKLIERDIDLRDFYMRRFFRLMPAAWTYLLVAGVLTFFSGAPFTSIQELRACLLFYRNFAGFAHNSVAGHFWSLSLEEQFYLVWPSILLLAGWRRSRWIAAGGAIACAVYRWLFWAQYAHRGPNFQSQVRADALLVGCAACLVVADPRLLPTIRSLSRVLVLPALATVAYCFAQFHSLPPLSENVAIAILMVACVLHPQSSLARLLSPRPLVFVGVISYSIYLWQELFIHLGTGTTTIHLVCVFIGTPLFALASYYCIERPCIRFGHRISKRLLRQSPEQVPFEPALPEVSSTATAPEIP